MSSTRIRIVVTVAGAVIVVGAVSAVATAIASPEPYYPEEGLNEQYAATLVEDLAGNDPLTDLAGHFTASSRDALSALIDECVPAARARVQPTVYADIVPVNARVILDAPGLPRCDMHLSWSESNGEAWSVHLTEPSPQDPLATPDTAPAG